MTEQHTPTPDSQEPQPQPFDRDGLAAKNRRVMAICLTCVAVMVSVSFAAVPLYNLFCSVTGFGGTTQVSDAVLDEDAATGRTMPIPIRICPGILSRSRPRSRSKSVARQWLTTRQRTARHGR